MRAYTIGLYEKAMPKELSWREKLEAAKDAGYDFLEISRFYARNRRLSEKLEHYMGKVSL